MDTLSLRQISPRTLAVFCFSSGEAQSAANKIAASYRLLYVKKGSLTLKCENKIFYLEKNDIIFIPPGTQYSTLIQAGFESLHVFFSITPQLGTGEFKTNFYGKPLFSKSYIEDFPEWNATAKYRSAGFGGKIDKMLDVFCKGQAGCQLALDALLCSLLHDIVQLSAKPQAQRTITIEDIEGFIDLHIDQPLSCRFIAQRLFYHPNYLNKLVRTAKSVTLHGLIIRRKVEFSKNLLSCSALSVTEIAHTLGFFDASHFSRTFTSISGISPLAFRNRYAASRDTKA